MLNSVRVRLTLWYVMVFGLLLAGFSVFVYTLVSRSLYDRFDQSLLNAANAAAGEFRSELEESNEGAASKAQEALTELQLNGVQIAILDNNQLLAANFDGNLFAKEFLAAGGEGATFQTLRRVGPEGTRVAAIHQQARNKEYLVIAAQPLDDLVAQLKSIKRVFFLGFPITLLVAGLGGFLLAKKSLAPVVAMSSQAERISARSLHERLSVKNQSDELGNLARVFNELLTRLSKSFDGMQSFMADASHELRTPLAIIRGEADVTLSEAKDTAECREALAIIQDEAKRLSRIVDDMLVLASADGGQCPLRVEEFYLNDLVEECCRGAQVLATSKGIFLTLAPVRDVAFRGDEDLLRRMIMNLLDNGIKYTPSGGSVSLALLADTTKVRIVVKDTGIGIPAESAARIFERFYRVDRARTRAEGGSGLGLSIAKWVAEAHNGSITLDSQPGVGSTLTVSLPLQKSVES